MKLKLKHIFTFNSKPYICSFKVKYQHTIIFIIMYLFYNNTSFFFSKNRYIWITKNEDKSLK